MAPQERRRLGNKYPSLFLTILILLLCVKVSAQTYNPSLHTVTNKAIGYGQATPGDARSMYYDALNFVYRPYQSVVEVKTYLNLAKYRYGNFIIVVDSGGILQPNGVYVGGHNTFWMFKDSTADANLVELNLQGSSGSCPGCLLAANNLSDLTNANTARANLGLGAMALLGTTAGGDLSGTFPNPTVARFNGLLPSYYLNYNNLNNLPAIPPQLSPTGAGLVSITGVYPSLTFTGRTPGIEETIFANNATSRTDSLNIGAFLFRFFGTSALGMPSGTTAQRPSSPAPGDTRWNTDSLALESWSGSAWVHPTGGGGGGGGITALTGDGTASGSGTVPFTLATVNSNVFGSNTFLKFGVNGKGLVTSATAVGSGDIISALGFTPYNATNPAGYISLSSLSANLPIVYNSGTGNISLSVPNTVNKYLNGFGNFVTLNTDSITEGSTNLFFTNARARTAISLTTTGTTGAATYNNSTGVFNVPQYQGQLTLTTTGTSGAATLIGNTLNIPNYAPGTGTVTSVALSTPSFLTTAGSPITTSGTFTVTLANQSANTVFGNHTGGSAAPTFGKVVLADQATNTANYIQGWDGSGNPTALPPDTLFVKNRVSGTGVQVGNISNDTLYLNNLNGSTFITQTKNSDSSISTSIANSTANTLLGWNGSGVPANITAGTNITISGGVISASGGGSGTDTVTQGTAPIRITRAGNVVTIGGDSLLNKYNSNYATLPQIKYYVPATGVNGTTDTVTNYGWANIDSALSYYTTSGKGSDNGGWLVTTTSGDSVQMLAPIGVYIGNSFAAGHPWWSGPLEVGGWSPNIVDPWGTTTHALDSLTHYKWYAMGIGGQTTMQIRQRFLRDAIGLISNPNDGRPSVTIGRKPSIIIIEGGINDLAAGGGTGNDSLVRDNLMWMAEMCVQYQIPCVMLNCPGDGAGTIKSYYQSIARLNKWMASGVLQSLGVKVVDLNKLWNTAEMNNYNFSSYVNSGDKIHLTQAGYDTLGKIIFNDAKIPVLTKMVAIKANSPTNPISNYNVPTAVTFTGVPYTLTSNPIDTVAINSYITDSVWMKITSSSGVGSRTGVNSVLWLLDNNPNNNYMYTEKTAFNGPQLPNQYISSLKIQANTYANTLRLIDVFGNDNSYNYFRLTGNASASSSVIINGGSAPTILNSAALTVYGHVALNSGSNIFVPGFGSTIGQVQFGNNSNPSTLGFGVGKVNSALDLQGGGGSSMANEVIRFSPFSNNVYTVTASATRIPMYKFNGGLGNGTDRDTASLIGVNFQFNNTETGNVLPGFRGVLDLRSSIVSRGTANRFFGVWQENGDNWLNSVTGKTSIGTINPAGSAKLDITSRTRGLLIPRMRQGQRDSIGYIGAVNITSAGSGYATVPGQTITGTGTGAVINFMLSGGGISSPTITDPGEGYKPGTSATISFSGGGGSGAAATLTINGPDSGLMIYNTTVDSLQWYKPSCSCWIDAGGGTGVNIYNTDGTLAANRTLSGGSFSLALGTSGSKLSNLSIWSTAGVNLTGGQYASSGGSQLLEVASTINNPVTAASGTVSNFSAYLFSAPTITSTNTSVTYASPATLRIDNSPTMGTNSTASGIAYALDVVAGINHMGVGSANFSLITDGGTYLNGFSGTNAVGVGLGASTTSQASLAFAPGSDLSSITTGTKGYMWWNGTNLYFVDGSSTPVKRDILTGINNYRHTIFTPTTGGTVTAVALQENIINPAGTLANLTIALPASPNNNDVIYFTTTQTLTAITYSGGTVVGPTTRSAGQWHLVFDSGTSSWY